MKSLIKKPSKPKVLTSIKKKKSEKPGSKAKTAQKIKKAEEIKNFLEVQCKNGDKKIKKKTKDVIEAKVPIDGTKKSKVSQKLAGNKKKAKSHKEDLEGLKEIDPEFYDFIKKNDKKLLEFNLLDSDEEDNDDFEKDGKPKKDKSNGLEDSDDEEIDKNDEKFHKPCGNLEVASDESDFEDEEEPTIGPDGTQKVSLNLLRQWQSQLEKNNVPIDTIRKVIQAFCSALASISGDNEHNVPLTYKVVGSAVFNGVIQLCVLHLQQAILRFLNLTPRYSIPLHKTKKWNKVRGCLRYYLTNLIRLVEQVSSPNILAVLLKHLHQMAGMVAPFSALGKTILKRLIVLWSTGDETVRVIAFLCILKITRNQQNTMLNPVLKAMYLSYVRNSKFVSPNTLPAINFMRRSLVEMFALDLNVTYQHAFLYIRQLAIHLRNAVILKKKDSFQACYNWQYVNSLRLWSDLLGTTSDRPQLQPLVYPLVTIATGVIRLIPTAQYFPLRFHCIQSLIDLAKTTNTFIPVLPIILEVLKSNTFNRKHTIVSMKPMQFTCILRLNKSQLAENGFRDEVIEQVCGLTLEYLAFESASIGFCDLAVHTIMALKGYLKECRNANYSRKIKQLLDKINENYKFIEQERRKINFALNDCAQIQAWETKVKNKGTPLDIYYNSWVKTHETKKRRQAARADDINDDYNLPTIKKPTNKSNVSNKNGEIELFPSDSEDDEVKIPETENGDNKLEEKTSKKKSVKVKISKKTSENFEEKECDVPEEEPEGEEDLDIVKDLDLEDW